MHKKHCNSVIKSFGQGVMIARVTSVELTMNRSKYIPKVTTHTLSYTHTRTHSHTTTHIHLHVYLCVTTQLNYD